MRTYTGRHHVAQPAPPKAQRADKFFWRGWRWGLVWGIGVGWGLLYAGAWVLAHWH